MTYDSWKTRSPDDDIEDLKLTELDLAYDRLRELEEALEQIAIVCTANMDRDCDHRMALDAVRQIANDHGMAIENEAAGKVMP